MKLQEQLFRKIKAQGKSPKTAETYWHYCEDYLRFARDSLFKTCRKVLFFVLSAAEMLPWLRVRVFRLSRSVVVLEELKVSVSQKNDRGAINDIPNPRVRTLQAMSGWGG